MIDLATNSPPEETKLDSATAWMTFDPGLHGKSILNDTDLTPVEILRIVETAATLKKLRQNHVPHAWLAGKTLGLIFQHPSTRTRTAFQAGMEQLGGQAIFLGVDDLQLRRGETIADTAAIFSRYVNGIAVRVENLSDMVELASGATVPVFNGLTSTNHPIEALSDVFTLKERFGKLKGLKFAYLGDGNNMSASLMQMCAAVGVDFAYAGPEKYRPDAAAIASAQMLGDAAGSTITLTDDPYATVNGADAVYTDVHESMGEQVNPGKLMALAPFRVTQTVMKAAKPEAVFMHCLPLHRGQEVESEVADGPQSIIFDQAENRLHVHKAVLLQALHDERRLIGPKDSDESRASE
ncbi:MAG: ornithine carbamoyltransferase [Chloroflexota bacterium]|nr:ornithine carbamoyltransferase [Chloroflexota bacterium]